MFNLRLTSAFPFKMMTDFKIHKKMKCKKRILQLYRKYYRMNNFDLHLIRNSYLVFDICPPFK